VPGTTTARGWHPFVASRLGVLGWDNALPGRRADRVAPTDADWGRHRRHHRGHHPAGSVPRRNGSPTPVEMASFARVYTSYWYRRKILGQECLVGSRGPGPLLGFLGPHERKGGRERQRPGRKGAWPIVAFRTILREKRQVASYILLEGSFLSADGWEGSLSPSTRKGVPWDFAHGFLHGPRPRRFGSK
jgi:hypothetical protein